MSNLDEHMAKLSPEQRDHLLQPWQRQQKDHVSFHSQQPGLVPSSMHSQSISSTFVDILRQRVQQQPDREIFIFLADGETQEVHWTYADLDQHARRIGALLQEKI